jgi:hypothetical protein
MTIAKTTMVPLIWILAGCLGSVSTPQSPTGGTAVGTDGGSLDGGGGGTTSVGTMLCSATLSLVGQWQQGAAPWSGFPGGCWPDGTWTFTASVTQNGCASSPSLEAQYRFQVMEDTNYNNTITYLNDPADTSLSLQISGGEGGSCVGEFLLFSSDGKTVINLRPALQADNSLNGHGDYQMWTADQR